MNNYLGHHSESFGTDAEDVARRMTERTIGASVLRAVERLKPGERVVVTRQADEVFVNIEVEKE